MIALLHFRTIWDKAGVVSHETTKRKSVLFYCFSSFNLLVLPSPRVIII